MRFLARQVSLGAVKKRLASKRPPHSTIVVVAGGHAFFQEISQQAGNAGISAGRLDARPPRDIFFESHGYIAELRFRGHENSVTRSPCMRTRAASRTMWGRTPSSVQPDKARQPRHCCGVCSVLLIRENMKLLPSPLRGVVIMSPEVFLGSRSQVLMFWV